MPVISDLRVEVTTEDVAHAWGPKRARLASPRMLARVSELLHHVETEHWLHPRMSFGFRPVAQISPEGIEFPDGSHMYAPLASAYFRGATHVGVGVSTLGDTLESQVAGLWESSDRLRGVLLDEIGTLALYRLSDRLEEKIQEEAARQGLEMSGVLNPGDDGFDLRAHELVLEISEGASIGVSVTSLGMLRPTKSISLVAGLGVNMPKWNRAERCEHCKMRERCPYRETLATKAAT